jgi:serine/threonine-protein kinase
MVATQVTERIDGRPATFQQPPAGWAPPSDPPPVLGEFRIVRKIGEGAMGAVYEAARLDNGTTVAMKVLFPHLAKNPKLLERFYREARIMGRLEHPNIVSCYAVGEVNGWHYFAMEYVDGRSLQRWISILGKLPIGDALHVTLAVADALTYAHGLDLVHRDIKPDNLLITKDGQVKITDFGAVKLIAEDLSLTQTGHGIGTPCYMPLEQARNAKDADGRSDIYALGCTLYCSLTGQPPFTGATLVELIQAKDLGRFTPARRSNPEVPERLDLIIDKMVAKALRYRYRSCAEVIKDIKALGLDNSSLSFIAPNSVSVTPLPRTGLKTPPPAQAGTSTVSPNETLTGEWWWLRYRTPNGPATRKFTTEQVLRLLADSRFDPRAEASRNPRDGFRALATYKEFESAAASRLTRSSMDQVATKFRDRYAEIDAEDRRRQQEKFRTESRSSRGGELAFRLYKLALIGVGGAIVYVILRMAINWLIGAFQTFTAG